MAPRNVVPALSYSGQITRAIKASRVMVLIFSEHANVSAAVLAEVELAANARVHILNFRVDASPLGDDLLFYLQHRHWLDALTPPMELHHARLVQSILGLLALASSAEETQLTTATKHPATSTPALSALVPGEAGGAQPRKFTMFRVLLLVALGMGAITAILIWIAGRSSAPQPAPTFAPKPIAATTPLATPESSPRTLLVPGTYSKIQAAIDAAIDDSRTRAYGLADEPMPDDDGARDAHLARLVEARVSNLEVANTASQALVTAKHYGGSYIHYGGSDLGHGR